MPKLNNSERYFKRALYLYIANIDIQGIYTQGINLLFHSLQGEAKKGVNPVATYLYCVLEFVRYNINLDSIKQIRFFSHAAGGQNTNWVIIKFCVFISVLLHINIVHLYPVRGHSYNIRGTNFAVIAKEFKKRLLLKHLMKHLMITLK